MKKLKVAYNTKICGIIDSYGSVHSKFSIFILCHETTFGLHARKAWRWSFQDSLVESIRSINSEDRITEIEWSKIREHITKQYGIEWWENGYHNIDQFQKQLAKRGNQE